MVRRLAVVAAAVTSLQCGNISLEGAKCLPDGGCVDAELTCVMGVCSAQGAGGGSTAGGATAGGNTAGGGATAGGATAGGATAGGATAGGSTAGGATAGGATAGGATAGGATAGGATAGGATAGGATAGGTGCSGMERPFTVTVIGRGGANGVVMGGGLSSCRADAGACSTCVPPGNVTLTATPDSPYGFEGWDTCSAEQRTCVFDGGTATATFAPYNYVFVTRGITPGALGGTDGGHAWCNAAARDGGLAGNYLAWLSQPGDDIYDRLRDAGARGWVRVDREPFADRLDDLVTGRQHYTLSVDERGAPQPNLQNVATGSNGGGRAAALHCNGWSGGGNAQFGNTNYGDQGWTIPRGGTLSCAAGGASLYCFGVDYHPALTVSPPPSFRLAFLTRAPFNPSLGGGRDAGDALCETEAAAFGLTGTFKALLATNGTSAASRFTMAGPPWHRVDRVPLRDTAQSLLDGTGNLFAPLNREGDGTPVDLSTTWTGAESIGAIADGGTCTDWTSGTGSGIVGRSGATGVVTWFSSPPDSQPCTALRRIYCLQQ